MTYRVIDGFDYKNEPCKLIEYIETEERYSTENDLEANSLCTLLNEQDERIRELEKENERLQNCIHRKRVAVKWLKRDYDKLYQLCLDKGFTEEELIKELDR